MPARRILLRWAPRVLGLGLVAFVLLTQVRWSDTLTRTDGRVLTGRVVAEEGGYRVEGPEGAAVHVPLAEVGRRDRGGREVADVMLGLPSLTARLAGHTGAVALALALLAALVVLTAWRWERLIAAVGLHLPLPSAVRLTWVGLFFNIAVPGATGGDVVKAWYAARLLGAPTRAVVTVFVDRILGLLALVLLAGAAVLLAPSDPAYQRPARLVLLCLAGAAAGAVVVLSRRVRRRIGLAALARRLPFAGVLAEVDEALRLYRSRRRAVGGALLVSLANHGGMVTAAWLLAGALGMKELTLAPLLVVVPLASLISAVPLLPGGWGVGEVAYAWLLLPFGVAPTEAVGLSVMMRLLSLVVSLPGGLLWMLGRGSRPPPDAADEVERAVEQLEHERFDEPPAARGSRTEEGA